MEEICRIPYVYDSDKLSHQTGLRCKDKSLTQQSFAEDADINTIVKRFGIDGQLPVGVRVPSYGDFTAVRDFRSAIEAVREAEASFMAMPARVRARFENDPQQFVAFCSDERNLEEMRSLGLAVPEEAPAAPVRVEVVEKAVPAPVAAAKPS